MENGKWKMKSTEIGPIPEDWEVKRLGKIGEPLMCKRILKSQTLEVGDVPFFKIGTFGKSADAFISRQLFENYKRQYSYPRKGDILISAAGTIGRTVQFDGQDAYFQDSNIVWIDHDNTVVTNDYLKWYYQIINWQTENGGTVSRLYNNNLKGALVAVPPLPEQRKIAAALSDVDEYIEAIGRLVEKKRAVKQGAMQELLTGKKRLAGFKGEWVAKKIERIGSFYTGLTGKSGDDFGRGESKYITFLNVLSNVVIDLTILEQVDVKNGEKQNSVCKGDVFFNTSSETPEEVGYCSVLNDDVVDVYLNSFCFGFHITDKNVSGHFLAYWFRTSLGRALMTFLAQGSTRYNLPKDAFKKTSIVIPSTLVEQNAIIDVLSDMDAEIAALEEKKSKVEAIKAGMMQELLTGKTRLMEVSK